MVAAPKNDGVTATIKQTPGAIGYIEYGYAKLTKADAAILQNKAGNYVAASDKSGAQRQENRVSHWFFARSSICWRQSRAWCSACGASLS
jgi:ABC-type phosphate transport system substrate-binding protein